LGGLLLNTWSKPFSSALSLAAPGREAPKEPIQFAVADLLGHALERNGQHWPRATFERAVEAIAEVADCHGYPPVLVLSLIQEESRFRLDALSPCGAAGLTQLLPSTAAFVAKSEGMPPPSKGDLFEAGTNIRLGFAFLAYLEGLYGSRDVALTVYNGGPEVLRLSEGSELPLASYRRSIRAGEISFSQWLKKPGQGEGER
jgi:soluble lytic murein transglycosylase-like protein